MGTGLTWNYHTQRVVAPKLASFGDILANTSKLLEDKRKLAEKRKLIEEKRQFQIDRENQVNKWNVEAANKKFVQDAGMQSARLATQNALNERNNATSIANNKNTVNASRYSTDASIAMNKDRIASSEKISKNNISAANTRAAAAQAGATYRAMLPTKLAEKQAKEFGDLFQNNPTLKNIFTADNVVKYKADGSPITKSDYESAAKKYYKEHPNETKLYNKSIKDLAKYNKGSTEVPDEIREQLGLVDPNDEMFKEKRREIITAYVNNPKNRLKIKIFNRGDSTTNQNNNYGSSKKYGKNRTSYRDSNRQLGSKGMAFSQLIKNTDDYMKTINIINKTATKVKNYSDEFAPKVITGHNKVDKVDFGKTISNIDKNIANLYNIQAAYPSNKILGKSITARIKGLQLSKREYVKSQASIDSATISNDTANTKYESKKILSASDIIKAKKSFTSMNADEKANFGYSFDKYLKSIKTQM